jgi:hypothetical protein
VPQKIISYTLALDTGDLALYRQQARMMVASLKRCGFAGDIKIIHNAESEIFDYPHPKVEEIRIDCPPTLDLRFAVKYQARDLFSVEGYDWVLFLDCDFIINAKLDAWFEGPEIIRYATEPERPIRSAQFNGFLTEREMEDLDRPGVNSGSFVVKAEYFHEVMTLWERLDSREPLRHKHGDQPAWNRLLLDTALPTKQLAGPAVSYLYENWHFMDLLKAPVLHFCGGGAGEKILAMQAKFITHFHTDDEGTLIRLLER